MPEGNENEGRRVPPLDPAFVPAVLWNRDYAARVAADAGSEPFVLGLLRDDGNVFVHEARILPHRGDNVALNNLYVERLFKFLLWQKGAPRIVVGGNADIAGMLRDTYSADGARAFDYDLFGKRMFLVPLTFEHCSPDDVPAPRLVTASLGRHLDGCRIGFDLGGSDRKCAAVVDGEVVFSDEVTWNPYFEPDPEYHREGIRDTLRRAAEKLPRVDAIGGSAAGDYINNEVRVASLFRGVSDADFEKHVRRMFIDLRAEWDHIPFDVVNDGEVTALAGSMSMDANAVLGVSMGTSMAGGYVTPEGTITPWLNELAFVPVDYRTDAPADEWSGDVGCGVQYFSQQAVDRLLEPAGIDLPGDLPLPEKLVEVQNLMAAGDPRARRIYETIGTYFGYTIAHLAAFYAVENLLVLGRVTSGEGGSVIIETAEDVLKREFPELAGTLRLRTPSEKDKRHGQAVAAASLPEVSS